MLSDIKTAYSAAYNTSFKAAYPVGTSSVAAYKAAQWAAKPSVSYSLKINDAVELAKLTSAGATFEATRKESANTNMPNLLTANEGNGLAAVGDTYSGSGSLKYTSTIKNVYTKSSYKLGGIISFEYKGDYKTTLKALANDKEAKKNESSGSGSSKAAVALSVSNTSTGKGAKFRWSRASESKSKTRNQDGGSDQIYSDLEVYDNNDNLVFTIKEGYSKYDSTTTWSPY